MIKLEIREKVLNVVYEAVEEDSKKLNFTKLEINKKGQLYSIKYVYTNYRSILILIRSTAVIEFYLRVSVDSLKTHIEYYNPKNFAIESIDDKFFERLKKYIKDIIKTMVNSNKHNFMEVVSWQI